MILYVVNDPAFFLSHRLPLAQAAARELGMPVALAAAPPADPAHADALRQAGVAFHPLPLRRLTLNPFVLLRAFLVLVRIIAREKPCIVHAVAMKALVLTAPCACVCRRPRYVFMITGLGVLFTYDRPSFRIARAILLAGLRACFALAPAGLRALVVQNADDARILAAAGLGPALLVPGSGVDTARLSPAPWPAEEPPLVFMAARLLRSKGVADFAQAARILRGRGVRARFVLAGDLRPDSPDALTNADVARWTHDGVLEWIGRTDDVGSWIARASVICYPSWYREGIPRFLLEAAAMGRPVVTTDHPGCRDAVLDGQTGILVPPRRPDCLADALASLLSSPGRGYAMGAAARKLAEERFDIAGTNAQMIGAYRTLLA